MNRRDFMKTGALASLGMASLTAFGTDSIQAQAVRENLNQPMLVVHDLWPEVQPLLDGSARVAVEERAHMNTVIEISENGKINPYEIGSLEWREWMRSGSRHTMLINYFGATVDSLQDGVGVLANILNEVTKKYEIRGHLLKAGAIELVGGEFAVITYLAVHYSDQKRVEDYKFWCQEGQVGPYLGKRSEKEREQNRLKYGIQVRANDYEATPGSEMINKKDWFDNQKGLNREDWRKKYEARRKQEELDHIEKFKKTKKWMEENDIEMTGPWSWRSKIK